MKLLNRNMYEAVKTGLLRAIAVVSVQLTRNFKECKKSSRQKQSINYIKSYWANRKLQCMGERYNILMYIIFYKHICILNNIQIMSATIEHTLLHME